MKNSKGFKKSLRKTSHHLLERTYSLRAKNEKLKYERMMILDLKHFTNFLVQKDTHLMQGSPPNFLSISYSNIDFPFLSLCEAKA